MKIKQNKGITKIWLLLVPAVGLLVLLTEYFYFKKDIFDSINRCIALAGMLPIAEKDYKEHIIPNKYLLWMLRAGALVLVIQLLIHKEYIVSILGDKMIGLLAGGGIFLAAMLISPDGIGAGDVKLYGTLGILLGFKAVFNVIFFSLIFGAICSIALLLIKKKSKKDVLPMAPYTLLGLAAALLLGV